MQQIQTISFVESLQSVFAGLSVSLFTPNRTGEFLGRMILIKKELQLKSISLSIAGSMAQWIATLFFATLSAFFAWQLQLVKIADSIFIFSIIVLCLSCTISIFIFYRSTVIINIFRNTFINAVIQKIAVRKISIKILHRILVLSFLRYIIFLLQYVILFKAFSVDVNIFYMLILVPCVITSITLIPTFAFSEIGIRGNVALYFLSAYTANLLGIVAAAFVLWILNLMLPALIGGISILNFKPTVTDEKIAV
jgi:uncharacterized membrane protein YbhN (UPF0104 family)